MQLDGDYSPIENHAGAPGKNIVIFSDGTGQYGGVMPDQRLPCPHSMSFLCRSSRGVAHGSALLPPDVFSSNRSTRYCQAVSGAVTTSSTFHIATPYSFIKNAPAASTEAELSKRVDRGLVCSCRDTRRRRSACS